MRHLRAIAAGAASALDDLPEETDLLTAPAPIGEDDDTVFADACDGALDLAQAPAPPVPLAELIQPARFALGHEDEPPFDPPDANDLAFLAVPPEEDEADDAPPAPPPHPRAIDIHALAARAAAASFAAPEESANENAGPALHPAPAISIYASWDRAPIGDVFDALHTDRRLARASVTIARGGLDGAIMAMRQGACADLVIVDTTLKRAALLEGLDKLAAALSPGAKIIVIGAVNDVTLFRELAARGVNEYVLGPLRREDLIGAVCRLYAASDASRVIAIVGARGGVGATTVAQNVAWSIAERQQIGVTLADLDLAFGAGALALEHAPRPAGSGEIVFQEAPSPSPRLTMLAAPAPLECERDAEPEAVRRALESVRRTNPFVILDVPHAWNAWVKETLLGADDIVIVATPDLASLRNAKNIVEYLAGAQPDGAAPIVVLSMVGVPKRPEIAQKDFTETLGVRPAAALAFEPALFGVCELTAKPIGAAAPQSKAAMAFDALATTLTGKEPLRRAPAQAGPELDPALLLVQEARGAYLDQARSAARADMPEKPAPAPIGLWRRIGRIAAAAATLLIASFGWHMQNSDPSAHAAEPREPASHGAFEAEANFARALEQLDAGRTQEAVALMRRAAEAGLALAQHRLAGHYERGEGVRADLAEARRWTARAAEAGAPRAMHDLGAYLAQGEGGAPDIVAAARWFRQAAEHGVADSQYNLGVLYQEGRGVGADAGEALFWFLAAAAQGDNEARARATALEAQLAPQALAAVRARAAHITGASAVGGAP